VQFIGHRATTWSASHRVRDASAASVLLIGVVPGTKQQPPLMSLLGVHALLVVNAELFCKRWVYSLPHESNGGLDGRLLPIHITHSISSSHLKLELLSHRVIRDLRIVFLRSNRISNRIGHPIRF